MLSNLTENPQKTSPISPFWKTIVLILIFGSAVLIRTYGIREEPLTFHPVKQYRSAMIAREIYYANITNEGELPSWKQEVTNANIRDIGILQPPIQSWIAAQIYQFAGYEVLWIPRLVLAISWVIGGLFLYKLAQKIIPTEAALFSLSFYLLLPFSVTASKSFQIDPLMVTCTVISLYVLVLYDESQSTYALLFAALCTSVAILLKPISFFILFAAFVGLRLSQETFPWFLFDKHSLYFAIISIFPTVLYYAYGIFIVEGVLSQQAVKSFVPIYFLEFRFWDGWLKRIKLVMGFTYFLGGLLGTLLYHGRARIFLLSLWVGYILMCLVFNYTISTHDYYHLLLIPIVALSLGSLATSVLTTIQESAAQWYWQILIIGILAAALFLTAGISIQTERGEQHSFDQIQLAQEIGEAVNHSTNTLYLAPEQGHSLLYYGQFSGLYWPYRYDIRDEQLWLGKHTSVAERFNLLNQRIDPEYFIVADKEEFKTQTELQQFITSQFPVFEETSNYVIFQLK